MPEISRSVKFTGLLAFCLLALLLAVSWPSPATAQPAVPPTAPDGSSPGGPGPGPTAGPPTTPGPTAAPTATPRPGSNEASLVNAIGHRQPKAPPHPAPRP